jgi:tryptophanyl-tRNA synthetase
MTKPVILTGLRANNDLHIGNYFGALLPLVDMATQRADEYEINLFVPDLHSFTTPIDHSQLQAQIMHNLKLFVAAGLPLHNDNIHIYRQSRIPAHSELTWILDCFTGFGQMSRMTQFKDKSQQLQASIGRNDAQAAENRRITEGFVGGESDVMRAEADSLDELSKKASNHITVGLFNYPVLMAADILLYDAKYVPVGDDQSQHLEFTRDIAERMNSKFGELFTVPEAVKKQHEFFGKEQGLRIKDLADPTKKMSKSDDTGKGVIFLGDDPSAAAKKIMSATTDNEGRINLDFEKQAGVSNLLQIHALLSGESLDAVAEHHAGQESYGALKKEVAEKVTEFLSEFQTRMNDVNEAQLIAKLEADEAIMNEKANETLLKVQKAVGLR